MPSQNNINQYITIYYEDSVGKMNLDYLNIYFQIKNYIQIVLIYQTLIDGNLS